MSGPARPPSRKATRLGTGSPLSGIAGRVTGAWSSPARRATLGGLVSTGVIQGSLLVSGVLTARALGVEARGELALLVLVPTVAVTLGGLGLPMATTYYVARGPGSAAGVVRTLAPVGALQAVALLAITAAVLALVLPGDGGQLVLAAVLVLPAVPARLLHLYALGVLQGQRRFGAYNSLRASWTAFYGALVLALFLAGEATLVAIAAAWTVSSTLAAVISAVVARRSLPERGTEQGASLRSLLRFGVRGVLGWASPIDGLRLDQSVIALFLSPAALGLYVVAQSLTRLPRFIAISVGAVLYPNVAARVSIRAARSSFGRFLWFSLAVTAVTAGGLAFLAPWLVPFFFGEEFADAVTATQLLLLAAFLWSVRRILTDGARGLGLAGLGTVAEVSSWIALVPTLAVLAAAWGYNGVAAALAISSGVSLLAMVLGLARRGMLPVLRRGGVSTPVP